MLRIERLTKRYGTVTAVDQLDLEIVEGEFFTLLGPSGCGKTTTLRSVGGLEKFASGAIYLRDRCLAAPEQGIFVPPEKRQMGMVFQSYALWPHMSVFENVAYPLKLRRVNRDDTRHKVLEALRLVGLEELANRQAPQLSGGQQQRVALARALVFSPQVLLLDEPLSNLDALLRDEMRRQLKALQRRVGVTSIYVTHDQVEALSLSDRIAILNYGRLEQVGTPREVYSHPATPFAQGFLGKTFSADGRVAALQGDSVQIVLDGIEHAPLVLTGALHQTSARGPLRTDSAVTVAIRPEHVKVWPERPLGRPNVVPSRVRTALFVGDHYEYEVELGRAMRVLPLQATEVYAPDAQVYLEFADAAVTVWPS